MKSSRRDDCEIIIVDDISTDRIDDIGTIYPELNIKLFRFEEKFWRLPVYGYNLAFAKAEGDIIAITNPEAYHVGDVISHVLDNIKDDNYLVYSSYSIDPFYTGLLALSGNPAVIKYYDVPFDGYVERGWQQHTKHRTWDFHWFTAIKKHQLDKLSGFNEEYIHGYSFCDTEFIDRVKILGLNIERFDDPHVLHQSHGMPQLNYDPDIYKINYNLYHNSKKEIYSQNSFITGNDIKYKQII